MLFHVTQVRYVVIELSLGRFESAHVGQLGFYVAVVDDQLRQPAVHSPTVGILLCASRNDSDVHYPLANTAALMAVANYTPEPLDPAQLNCPAPPNLRPSSPNPWPMQPHTRSATPFPSDGVGQACGFQPGRGVTIVASVLEGVFYRSVGSTVATIGAIHLARRA